MKTSLKYFFLFIFCGFFLTGFSQKILNGSFEKNKFLHPPSCGLDYLVSSFDSLHLPNVIATGLDAEECLFGQHNPYTCGINDYPYTDTLFPYPDGVYCALLIHSTSYRPYPVFGPTTQTPMINLKISLPLISMQKYLLVYYDYTPNFNSFTVYDSVLVGTSISGNIMDDTLNVSTPVRGKWLRHSKLFTVRSASNYISVRNYKGLVGVVEIGGVNDIDDFQLYHLDTIHKQNVSICPNDSIKIYATQQGKRYEWSKNGIEYERIFVDSIAGFNKKNYGECTNLNGDSTANIYAVDTGWYWNITYLSDSTISMDSIHVYYGGFEYNPTKDITFCIGDTFTLIAPTRTYLNPTYLWNTGETNSSVNKYNTGIYWVKTTVSSCLYLDTFDVSMKNKSSIKLVNDTSICFGTKIKLNAISPFYNIYKWNTGDTTSSIIASNAGKYVIIASDGICSISDTSTITTFFDSIVSLPQDTSFCSGRSYMLNATNNTYSKYLWSTGANTSSIIVNIAGIYSVIASDTFGCTAADTVKVFMFNATPLNIVNDTFFCICNNLIIDAKDSVYNNYKWNTGETTSKINITQPGKYVVTATNGICTTSDSVNVKANSLPQLHLTKDTVICFDDIQKVVLDAGKFKSYYWYPTGETTETIYATIAEQYVVVVTDTNNCINKDTTLVEEKCGSRIYVPNAFTPNGDGINDIFYAFSRSSQSFEMKIYNRWGEQIFSSTDILKGWDGTFQNIPCISDTYVWQINYTLKGATSSQTASGNVQLLK